MRVDLVSAGASAVLTVSDDGIGIPPAAQARLFEPFYRASNAGARTTGFGLGLYVVHEIVEAHAGTITVTSAEGQGSTFRVTLPLDPSAAPA